MAPAQSQITLNRTQGLKEWHLLKFFNNGTYSKPNNTETYWGFKKWQVLKFFIVHLLKP